MKASTVVFYGAMFLLLSVQLMLMSLLIKFGWNPHAERAGLYQLTMSDALSIAGTLLTVTSPYGFWATWEKCKKVLKKNRILANNIH